MMQHGSACVRVRQMAEGRRRLGSHTQLSCHILTLLAQHLLENHHRK